MDRRELLKSGLLGVPALGALTACGGSQPASSSDDTSLIVDVHRQPDETVALWPDVPPGGVPAGLEEHYVERENQFGLPDRAAHDVTRPALSIFKPENPTGEALLLIPGGGYRYVVVEKEGWEGARYFNRRGITCYVMTYRLPHQGWAAGSDAPLQDAQRAMRVIRARAQADNIDPARLAAMGFSAGGHVAGSLGLKFDADVYAPVDDADRLSARPDRLAMIYPVVTMRAPAAHEGSRIHLIGEAPAEELYRAYSLDEQARGDAPPTFFLHSSDDLSVPVANSVGLYSALNAAGVPVAMHVFTEGGHGFGVRGLENTPQVVWPQLVLDWWRKA